MNDWLVLSVVLTTLLFGFWLGKRKQPEQDEPAHSQPLHDEYFVGLNYLLSDRTDEAIDAFIRALEVNSETIPAYLALARLFRRKGDVDRAIKVHQNLLARPDLLRVDALTVQAALAKDYEAVGLLDRAETLLNDILRQAPPDSIKTSTLLSLIKLYEKEQEWEKAVETAEQLDTQTLGEIAPEVAHYLCEQSVPDISAEHSEFEATKRLLNRALAIDPLSVRVSLLFAQWYMVREEWKLAIKHLQQVEEQDPAFISETVPFVCTCYEKLKQFDELKRYLEHCMSVAPSASVMLAIADLIREDRGAYAAGAYITDELKHHPTVKGFNRLIDLHLHYGEERARDSLLTLRSLTGTLAVSKPRYRCQYCGYAGQVLLWHCPSCKKWNSTKPIRGLEGE